MEDRQSDTPDFHIDAGLQAFSGNDDETAAETWFLDETLSLDDDFGIRAYSREIDLELNK